MKKDNTMADVSVDCVIFGFDERDLALKVLLIEQGAPGIEGEEKRYALPGDLILDNEGLDDAAVRVLEELTGLQNVFLTQFYAFGNPQRVQHEKDKAWLKSVRKSPDARVVTIGYYSLIKLEDYKPEASSFARDTIWTEIANVPGLAFDHNEILNRALHDLREQIKMHPIGFELLPKKFTLSQLQRLNEIILNEKLDKRNFRRKVQKMPSVIALDEKQQGVFHKPARLYVYEP
jgi:8-oxo-dGTP diphosphatase